MREVNKMRNDKNMRESNKIKEEDMTGMRSKKKNTNLWKVVILLVVSISLLAGCGNGAKEEKSKEKVLIYGSGDYTAINPAIKEHGEINSLIFTGLMKHDLENNVETDLAQKVEGTDDLLTYTFTLREDATFHDGEPVKAEDVEFTLKSILNPDNGSEIVSNYEDITDMKVLDDYKISITLKEPNVAFLDYMTIGILPKHLLEGKDIVTDGFNQKPVGTGPYKLISWDMGQSITLEKYDGYYNGSAKVDKVIFKIVDDADARALQLKSGELDLAQITPKASKELEGTAGYTTLDMKTADYTGIMYNFNHKLFKENRELPNALSYAIDRQAIIDTVLLGQGTIAYSPLQTSIYNNPDVEKYEYNPEKAKTMLEDAGWKIGANGYYEKKGQELGFTINNGQGDQVRVDMSNICAQNLQEIGVNAKVKVNAETDWGGQEAYLIGWGSPFDPDDHTYKVFGTDKGANYSSYSNGAVDSLLTKARELQTMDERIPVYQEFQNELSKDLPFTFIAYINAIYMANSSIAGITPDKVLGHHGVGIFWNIEQWDIQ